MMLRSDLDHLPEHIRQELDRVVQVLFEETDDAMRGAASAHRKAGQILKVILFGSFARGDWVDDRVSGYRSDYDLLVVVNHEDLTDSYRYWDKAADRFVRELTIAKTLGRPLNFIVHSLADLNDKLKRGRPFFMDILRDGVALYEAPNHPLEAPRALPPEEVRAEAQAYFEEWFPGALGFLDTSRYSQTQGRTKEAAFLFHQATERLYHCVLLVLTLYSPRAHRLEVLRSMAEDLDARLVEAWPRETRFERRAFDRIRRAYVEARYSPHYQISDEELTWAAAHVERLAEIVRVICVEHLGKLSAGAQPEGADSPLI
jgi:predicted nucleotidyltransferase/HEPN domain-containing protein